MVSKRIHHAALPQPVGLISDHEHLACACRHRARLGRVCIVNMERDADGCCTSGFGARRAEVRCLSRHTNALPIDHKDRHLRPVRRDKTFPLLYRTERLRIERHRRVYVLDREERIDLGHAAILVDRLSGPV